MKLQIVAFILILSGNLFSQEINKTKIDKYLSYIEDINGREYQIPNCFDNQDDYGYFDLKIGGRWQAEIRHKISNVLSKSTKFK